MKKLSCALMLLAATTPAQAEDLIHWWDVSGTVLYGDDYDLAPSANQTTLTFETAGGWKYGDWFMFQDVTYYNGDNFGVTSTTYGEIAPRFSLGKMTGSEVKFGPVKDVLIALTYEEGEGPVQSFLYGVGLDLAIPGFTYFSLNTYKRHAISTGNISDGWQLTPAFRVDFPIGNADFVFDGFMDWVFSSDNAGYDENIHFNPQLKFDLGKALFGDKRANKLYVGIEYDYWKSKYGVDGIDQNTYSVVAQYHF